MTDERIGWEGWCIALVVMFAVPASTLLIPIVGGALDMSVATQASPSNLAMPPLALPRLLAGLGAALAFLIAAWWLVHRTDWETPVQ